MSLVRFSNQTPSVFDRVLEKELYNWSNRNFSKASSTLPAVNIQESDEAFQLELAAPGFKKADFKVELVNDLLTIFSEKKSADETTGGFRYTKKEFNYQSFSRSFNLPDFVDGEKIVAAYENGILTLTIPKKAEEKPKPSRQIEIK